MELQRVGCVPAGCFAVVDCTLACDSITLCLTVPRGRVGCSTPMQDGETPAAAGVCSRVFFYSCYSRRKLPQGQPCRSLCLLWPGQRGRGSPGTRRLSQSPGAAACAAARGWHQCLFTFSSPDGRALPCCRRQPVGCQPCLSWQELEINLLLK